jgi:hypothetical protein
MSVDLLAERRRAADNYALNSTPSRANLGEVAGVNGTKTSLPIYSKVRIAADGTPGSTTSMFKGTSVATPQQIGGELHFFDYAAGDVASVAGFGTTTQTNMIHTNVTTKREVPNGGDAFVAGFQISASILRKPAATTSVNTISDDTDGSQLICSDVGKMGLGYFLDAISHCFLPFVQQASGEKEYLGKMKFEYDAANRLFVSSHVHPEGWVWGSGKKLILGLELKADFLNAAYVSDAAGVYGAFLASAMDYANDGNAPAAKALAAIIDLTAETISYRTDPTS